MSGYQQFGTFPFPHNGLNSIKAFRHLSSILNPLSHQLQLLLRIAFGQASSNGRGTQALLPRRGDSP
jgi:hypothetical protein